MAALIAEAVLSACESSYGPKAMPTRFAPVASEFSGRRGLMSVQRLDQDIAERQRSLVNLQAARDSAKKSLLEVRAQLIALRARGESLELTLSENNQAAFLLVNNLDRLQMVRAKVAERAQRIAQKACVVVEPPVMIGPQTAENDQPVADPTERRMHARTPVVAEVGITTDNNFYTGFTQDISNGGLFIATPDASPIGTRFLLECKLPETNYSIQCTAEVAWVREYHEGMSYELGAVSGMGVKFVELTAEDAAAIAAFQAMRESLFFPDGSEGC